MNCVNAVVVSPDDSLALCHDDDSILWIWDLRSGLLRRKIETDRSDWINCSARHPTRPVVVAGVHDGGLLVVDMDAGDVVAELPSGGELNGIAVSPDGREAWTAHDLGRVEIRALDGDGQIRTVDVGWGDVSEIVARSPGRAFIAVDGQIQEWDLGAGTRLRTLGEAHGTVASLALSPAGSRLAAGWADGRIDLWDVADGAHTALAGHSDREFRNDVAGLDFTPDGGRLVSGSWDETVRVWSSSGEPFATLRGHSSSVYALAVFDAGRRAVSASKDGTLRVWDLRVEPVPEPDFAHAAAVDALAARTGIAVSGARDRCLAVWELETGRAIRHWDAHAGRELHEGWVTAVALDPDGDTIHSAGQDGALKTWTADGTLVDAVEGDWGSSGNTALARDVPLLVGGDGRYGDARVSFWRPGRKTRLGRVKVGQTRSAIGVSPDGRIALAADLDGGFAVVDPKARRVLWNEEGRAGRRYYAEDVAISPDGRRAIIGMSDGRVELWDLVHRRKRQTFRLHADRTWAVAISPDGALGCSAGWDRVLRVWDLDTGELIASYSSDDFWATCIFAGGPRRVLAADERGGLHFLALENYA